MAMAHSLGFSIFLSPHTSRIIHKLDLHLPQFRPISAVSSEIKPSSVKTTLPSVEIVPDRSVAVAPSLSQTEDESREKRSRRTRKTKLVCTIGPATCGFDKLEALAIGGMNVARINMCHGSHEWHQRLIERVRRLNEAKGCAIAIIMDIQGSEIHMGDLGGATSVKAEDGDNWTFSVRSFNSSLPERTVSVNYDGFAEDVRVGDEIVVDGGMAIFEVVDKVGPDVRCRCVDPGLLLPRANLTLWREGRLLQERNAMLPTISSKDWLDIDFGIKEGVDFIAVSFVKSAEVINHLKSYIAARTHDGHTSDVAVIAKIENIGSLKNLNEIITASDGVMVARGDLGAQIPLEQVPSAQNRIVNLCRQLNKPVIVASQLLESMIEFPIPTRAEVADVSEAVRQKADALMLSGESAMGQYPQKALSVLGSISLRIEKWLREQNQRELVELPDLPPLLPGNITEELCSAAAKMANNLEADGLIVYTRTGQMAYMLSRHRPDCPIFAFTPSMSVQRRLNLHWGLMTFSFDLSDNAENNLSRTFTLLKGSEVVKPGDTIISISDRSKSIQVLIVP